MTKFKNSSIQQIIGRNIAYYRVSNKLSQQKLADKIGISRQHLSHIENNYRNTNPKLSTLKMIAKGLNISVDDFYDEFIAPIRKSGRNCIYGVCKSSGQLRQN